MAIKRRTWLALALLMGGASIAALVVWQFREPIARDAIDDELSARKVPGSYEIEALGTRRQRLVNVRLGDPVNPDLVADWVEIDTGISLSGVAIKAVRAGGVRLNARLDDNGFTMGSVDRLLPAPDGKPFSLPAYDVLLKDARMVLATQWGTANIGLDGQGRLDDGFVGRVAASAQDAGQEDCRVQRVNAEGAVHVSAGQPRFDGPVTLAGLTCGGVALKSGRVELKAQGSADFAKWQGDGGIAANGLAMVSQGLSAQSLTGNIRFDPEGKAMALRNRLVLGDVRTSSARLNRLTIDGSGRVGHAGQGSIGLTGKLNGAGFAPDRALLARMGSIGGGEAGSPVAPLVQALKRAIGDLERGSGFDAVYSLEQRHGRGEARLGAISALSASGARLAVTGEMPLRIAWPGGLALDGDVSLTGGGFPAVRARLTSTPGGISGTASVAEWRAGDSRLALQPVRFRWTNGKLSLDTRARLDGPLGAGRIEGLDVPLALRPGANPLSGCFTPSFSSLRIEALQLRNGRLNACLRNGEAVIDSPHLSGLLGSEPVQLAASNVRLEFGKGDFTAQAITVLLGTSAAQSRLTAERVTGTLRNGGAAGRFDGLAGRLAAVPILADRGSGSWTLNGGRLDARMALRVSDANPDIRYRPLDAPDFRLSLANGLVNASGMLRNAPRDVDVAQISIEHRLSSGIGEARIDMPGIVFGQRVQPEELTPVTLGVIANVEGRFSGNGIIRWNGGQVTSSGEFGTEGMDMAAAFGPVTGLSGRIALSDLLGMETPPGQTVKIAGINPGIAVLNGEIRYRLLPGLKAEIEGGSWPFAGGVLRLAPTILDLNQSAERRLTLKVEGIDAARFIAAMEFENIAATGKFDGELPLIFDKDGGRIEGGYLVAQQGGTVSYVGEISNERIGAMGRFAFDALKSIKYSRLRIELDGAIDGDVITRIAFAGINQAPIEGVRARFPIPVKVTGLTGIPFIFNVTITAKFRQLFEMARSFNDPSILINRVLPQLEPVPGEKARSIPDPVQPSERPPAL